MMHVTVKRELVLSSKQTQTQTSSKTPPPVDISPTTSSHGTNLAFFLTEDGFNRLLLTTFFLGRSLKWLSLVCGNSMLDPDLLVTTTSSRPPIISTALLKESRNYSPAQNPALSSASAHEPCEPVCKPAPVSACCWQEVMSGDFTVARGCSAACFRTEWSCGWNAEWSETTYHSHLSPPMSLLGDTPCTARLVAVDFNSSNRNVEMSSMRIKIPLHPWHKSES